MNIIQQDLPRRIVLYAALGMLITVLLVSLITTLPLYRSAKVEAEQTLLNTARARALLVQEHLANFANIARQVSSRAYARQLVEAYNQGEIDPKDLQLELVPILDEALQGCSDLAGIMRLDKQGDALIGVGMSIPPAYWPALPVADVTPRFGTPFVLNGQPYLVVDSPIVERGEQTVVGADVLTFRLQKLWGLLEERTGLGRSGRLMLGRLVDGRLQLFGTADSRNLPATVDGGGIAQALTRAGLGGSGILSGETADGRAVVTAYHGVDVGQWGLALSLDANQLYAPAYHQIRNTLVAIGALLLVGIWGTVRFIKPLAGRIVIDNSELNRQIAQKTSELAASRERLAEAQRIAHIGSFDWDLADDSLAGSDEFYRILGLGVKAGRCQSETLLQRIQGDDRERIHRQLERVRSQPGLFSLDLGIVTPAGEARVLHMRTISKANHEGRIATISGTVQDVTERANVETVMRALAQGMLDESEADFFVTYARNLAMLYHAKVALIGLLDADQTTVTTQVLWVAGRQVSNITQVLDGTPCEDIIRLRRKLITTGLKQRYSEDAMLRELDLDSYYGSRIVGKDGRVLGLVAVMDSNPLQISLLTRPILDVFASRLAAELEQRWAQRKLAAMNESLEQRIEARTRELLLANQELEAYSYSIAHDLRAPLRSMISFSQVVVEEAGDGLNAEARDALQRVVRAGNYMARLIDEILELSRITRSELRPAMLDLSRQAEQHLRRLAAAEPERRVKWHIEAGLRARGDATLVHILLQNLLGNAWKFTARRDDACIEVGSGDDEDGVFFIRDNGVGFDMRYADKLFQIFSRLHGQGEFEGTGIGLVTVKRIVERHGGRVWIESEPGRGTTVYFSLDSETETDDEFQDEPRTMQN